MCIDGLPGALRGPPRGAGAAGPAVFFPRAGGAPAGAARPPAGSPSMV